MEDYLRREKEVYFPVFARYPVLMERAEGKYVYDSEGNQYLDFFSGLGVCILGHSHPRLRKVIEEQIQKLIHISNLYYTEEQIRLAEELSSKFGKGKCFFSNSGAEANEAALKLTRKFGYKYYGGKRYKIITAYGSFHGRTFKTLAATGQPEKQRDFEPLPPGFDHVPLNDFEALEGAIDDATLAVMLEPIQGEGGVNFCSLDYLKGVEEICRRQGLLLILDEVQTGVGRTGSFFAFEHFGVKPDVVTLAKGLGSGFPIGATIARAEIADFFERGDHGSTFGGNALACAVALETLKVLEEERLIEEVARNGALFLNQLKELENSGLVADVRGKGFMLGVEFNEALAKEVSLRLLKRGILSGTCGEKVLRFLPPFIVERDDFDLVLDGLKEVLEEVKNEND